MIYVRDFAVLGAAVAAFSPLPLLAVIIAEGADTLLVRVYFIIVCVGGLIGSGIGAILWAATRLFPERPLLLAPVGFPLGSLMGALFGAAIGTVLHRDLTVAVAVMGAITAGFCLGLTWLPYHALRLRDRSGLPVIGVAAFCAPLFGLVASITAAMLEL